MRKVCHFVAAAFTAAFFIATAQAQSIGAPHSAFADYGASWNKETHSELAAFDAWATRYLANPKAQSLANGISLAKKRRAAMAQLIARDPAAAIAAAVPIRVRRRLPPEITGELEARVAGIADYSVVAAIQARRGPAVIPVQRLVHVNGQTYRAHVYGRRLSETTKKGIPLHGIALGDSIALHESALRILEPDETPDPAKPTIDLSASAFKPVAPAKVTYAEAGDHVYRFASLKQLRQAEARIEAAEARIGPNASLTTDQLLQTPGPFGATGENQATPSVAQSPYTEGDKKLLVIRIDFSDLPGDPQSTYTASYVANLANTQISPFYLQSSYGRTSLTNTVTTQLYRMPRSAAYYATNGFNDQLHNDARTAASTNYAVSSYDRVIVLFSWLGNIAGSRITYGGLAEVGGPYAWVNGEFDFRVVAHELGHTYGLFHANLWQVYDGNPASASGSSAEYQDDYDTMGANFADDPRTDFNPWFKNTLDWIDNAQITNVTSSGTYRINRFDNGIGNGTLALKIFRDANRNYWLGCRRKFTDNSSMTHGLYVTWGYNLNDHSDLLDMTTPGRSDQDAALAIGATFADAAANLAITPVAEGGTAPNQYIDVQVNLTPFGQNDNFADAQTLGGSSGHVSGNNTSASKEVGEPNHAGNPGGKSIWYRWTPLTNWRVTFDTFQSSFDTTLAAYTGSRVDSLTAIASNDDANGLQSRVEFDASAGTSYYIAVDGYGAASGYVSLHWVERIPKADFNSDGYTDYLLFNATTRRSAVWELRRNAFLAGIFGPTLPAGWALTSAADVNGDGKPDYVLFNAATHRTAVWFIDNMTLKGGAYGPTLPVGWTLIAAVDFNQDGRPDFLLFNPGTHRTAIWFLRGTTFVRGVYGPTLPAFWNLVDADDFDGDGNPDFLLFDPRTNYTDVWYLAGTSFIGEGGGPALPAGWIVQGSADFNHDGKADFVLVNSRSRQTALWYLDRGGYLGGAFGPTLVAGYTLVAP